MTDLEYVPRDHRDARIEELEEENERLRADQTDWRKGVELIASALGEHSPPNLDCVRISRLALEQRARIEAALVKIRRLKKYGQPWYGAAIELEQALKGGGGVNP